MCSVLGHNPTLDTYVVEFDGFKNTQVCHASQLYPVLDMAVSVQGGSMESSAEGAEGSLQTSSLPSLSLLHQETLEKTTLDASKAEVKREQLQKLASIDKQKANHSRQLKRLSSYDANNVNAFKREGMTF